MNSNVWKAKADNPVFPRIRSEFQCFLGCGVNSNVCKDKVFPAMFERISCYLQCLKG